MLTLADAARRLEVSEQTVRRMTRDGRLPDRRDGWGRRVFCPHEVKELRKKLLGEAVNDEK